MPGFAPRIALKASLHVSQAILRLRAVAYLFSRLLLDEQLDLQGLSGLQEGPPLLLVRQKVGSQSDEIGRHQQQAVDHNLEAESMSDMITLVLPEQVFFKPHIQSSHCEMKLKTEQNLVEGSHVFGGINS